MTRESAGVMGSMTVSESPHGSLATPLCKSSARQRMQERTAIEARRLAKAACAAAEAPAPSDANYARLREVACALNEREQWATQEAFDAAFPTAATLDAADDLARASGLRAAPPSPSARRERLRGLLFELCGWATGIEAADQARKPRAAT